MSNNKQNNKNYLATGLIFIIVSAFVAGYYASTLKLEYEAPFAFTPRPDFPALPDFRSYKDIQEKKEAFFNYLLPMIDYANTIIKEERAQVLKIAKSKASAKSKQTRLADLEKKYFIESDLKPDDKIKHLLNKVDLIPPSLVLAQAANESAWGTSRFAVKGNNLFGQWCFKKGCGLVPNGRKKEAKHEVAKFDSPLDSVQSYMLNINRHQAYRPLRDIRAQFRKTAEPYSGVDFAAGLTKYSERREAYVEEIQNMIRFNKLEAHDANLSEDVKQG